MSMLCHNKLGHMEMTTFLLINKFVKFGKKFPNIKQTARFQAVFNIELNVNKGFGGIGDNFAALLGDHAHILYSHTVLSGNIYAGFYGDYHSLF